MPGWSALVGAGDGTEGESCIDQVWTSSYRSFGHFGTWLGIVYPGLFEDLSCGLCLSLYGDS